MLFYDTVRVGKAVVHIQVKYKVEMERWKPTLLITVYRDDWSGNVRWSFYWSLLKVPSFGATDNIHSNPPLPRELKSSLRRHVEEILQRHTLIYDYWDKSYSSRIVISNPESLRDFAINIFNDLVTTFADGSRLNKELREALSKWEGDVFVVVRLFLLTVEDYTHPIGGAKVLWDVPSILRSLGWKSGLEGDVDSVYHKWMFLASLFPDDAATDFVQKLNMIRDMNGVVKFRFSGRG